MILLVAEHAGGKPRRSALELVSVGRTLAAETGSRLAALVFGADPTSAADQFANYLPEVYVVRDPILDPPRADTATRVVAHAASELGATIVLVPGSRAGMSYGPRVALRLGGSYLENASTVAVDGGDVIARRPSHLARLGATVVADGTRPTVVCLGRGAEAAAQGDAGLGQVHDFAVPFEADDLRLEVVPRREFIARHVALEDAEVVICGGFGLGSAEAFERHAAGLAERLGAAVGVTRAVVDAGWRPFEDLVGQTGKTVSPMLCVTLGVSGAPHLLSGLNRSRVIVAVNKDAGAPIFRSCDYGIVGTVEEVVPALVAALAEADPG